MSIFGFEAPEPVRPAAVEPWAPPPAPASVAELRDMIEHIDRKLIAIRHRTVFTEREATNLLLDVRNMLERLTSPMTLVHIALQITRETKQLAKELGDDPSV